MNRDAILRADRTHVWHPYTSFARAQQEPLVIARAEGSWIYEADGRAFLDANASWWMSGLGHRHPRVLRAIAEQLESLDHVAFAGITHAPGALLAEELCSVAPRGLSRVFYTDNGSGAIEAAVKLCLQSAQLRNEPKRTRFLALDGAFHGDTVGAASLSGVEVFRRPFASVLFECVHVPFPDSSGYAAAFDAMVREIETRGEELAGVFVEPIVQGAAGMRWYPPEYLQALRAACTRHGVRLVCDEVFTGFGRTGTMWACDHAGITPDILCVGKSFTSSIPFAAALTTPDVFDAFAAHPKAAFHYGHTFAGYPLGAAVAREVLRIYADEALVARAAQCAPVIQQGFERCAAFGHNVRALGMIGAIDLGTGGYEGERGWMVYEEALKRGAYLRPLGDTVYITPPLTISDADLAQLLGIVYESIRAACSR